MHHGSSCLRVGHTVGLSEDAHISRLAPYHVVWNPIQADSMPKNFWSCTYEAKARGVTRGMRIAEIRKVCPDAIILPSDYETYSLLSKRFFAIVRRYTPDVEEYSIDECFADLTGLRRPLRMSYLKIAERIKKALDAELGFTFSVGLAPNKVVAKIASTWAKPSGLTAIPGRDLHQYLAKLPVEKVWGIGPNTTAFLRKH